MLAVQASEFRPAQDCCRPSERRRRSPLNDDRAGDDQTEEQRQQDGRYEPLPQIEFLDVGHADRLVVAGAQALSHRQMPRTNGDQDSRLSFCDDVEGIRSGTGDGLRRRRSEASRSVLMTRLCVPFIAKSTAFAVQSLI